MELDITVNIVNQILAAKQIITEMFYIFSFQDYCQTVSDTADESSTKTVETASGSTTDGIFSKIDSNLSPNKKKQEIGGCTVSLI